MAQAFFGGRSDLIVVRVRADRLDADLVYEENVAPGGAIERFPHLYGELNLDAVTGTNVSDLGQRREAGAASSLVSERINSRLVFKDS